jgi:hypothetical protein
MARSLSFPATPGGMRGRRRRVMSSTGSGLAVRTGRFQGVIEEIAVGASTGNYLWLGVWRRDLPTNLDVFLAFLAPTAPRAKYGGVRHRSRFPAIKNYVRAADRCLFGKSGRTVTNRAKCVITPTTVTDAIQKRFVLWVDVTHAR